MKAQAWIAASVGFALAAVAAPASSGSVEQVLLYPVARLFGVPPESELAQCRAAFGRLQGRLDSSTIMVEPVMYAPGHERQWRGDWARALARRAGARSKARFTVAPADPGVAFPRKMYHNQLRYMWDRSQQYGSALGSVPAGVDYVCFVEAFVGQDGKVAAIQAYVFERGGQLAFARLFNSHHFGGGLSPEGDATVDFVVASLFDTLAMAPDAVFPPYGVG